MENRMSLEEIDAKRKITPTKLDFPAAEISTDASKYRALFDSFTIEHRDVVKKKVDDSIIELEAGDEVNEKMVSFALWLMNNKGMTYRSPVDPRSSVDEKIRERARKEDVVLYPERGFPKGFITEGGALNKNIVDRNSKECQLDDKLFSVAKYYSGKNQNDEFYYTIFPSPMQIGDFARREKANAVRATFGENMDRPEPIKYLLTWTPNVAYPDSPGYFFGQLQRAYNQFAEMHDKLENIVVLNFFSPDIDEKIEAIKSL